MAKTQTRQRTIVSRLADAGEDAIQRLGGTPGADRVLGVLNGMRGRMDDMQKQLRAIASIEKRLNAIERRLDKIEGKGTSSRRSMSSSSRKRTSSSSRKTSS